MDLQILELSESSHRDWDEFVKSQRDGTFFHLSGWKTVIESAFGHKSHFLHASRNGQIEGILPLAQVKSRLFGNSLTSLPFCVYGGIVAANPEAEAALRDAACQLATQLKVDVLELRNINSSNSGWPTKDLYATFRKPISADPEENMKAIPSKQRTMIRKGIRNELQSDIVQDPDRMFRVYSESVRNLGTPVFTSKYFKVLLDVFARDCSILMITHQGRDVAGVLSFYYQNQVLPYYGGSIKDARSIKAVNDFMYWDLMCRAAEQGCTQFDFGRSKVGTGPYKFKCNWGFEPEPLHYEYFLVNSDTVPEVNPNNPKYQKLISTWKKLPLPVANTIGPLLAKSLG